MPVSARFTALTIAILALLLVTACGAGEDDATPTPERGGSAPTATDAPGPTATAGQERPALDGTAWLLAALNGADIDLQAPLTLTFEDGQAGGFSGCNEFGGAYTATDAGEFSMPEIAMTDMDCEVGMDLEADYLEALAQAARYEVIEEVRLELHDSNGETLLVFTSDTREALDATSWTLVEVDGAEVLAGTSPTLQLRAGETSGSTGCNQFGGRYSADDEGALTFSELFWTERGCVGPAGVMEQEAAVLDALARVGGYRPVASGLELLDEAGHTLLAYERAAA